MRFHYVMLGFLSISLFVPLALGMGANGWVVQPSTIPATGAAYVDVTIPYALPWHPGDMLAVYCPPVFIPNGEVCHHASTKAYLNALTYVPLLNATHKSVRFHRVTNMRCDYQYVYLALDGPDWMRFGMYHLPCSRPQV